MQRKSMTETAGLKDSNITKIVFYDGRGGLNQPLSVENRQKIDEFMSSLSKCNVKKSINNPLRSGWIHSAVFFSDKGRLAEITFGDYAVINKEYYDVAENSLNASEIDDFLKTVSPTWKTP